MSEISRTELFLGFLKIGLLGFGGVAPWARYVSTLASKMRQGTLASLYRASNAIIIGDRFKGIGGAISAVLGMLCMPIAILIGIAVVYDRIESLPAVQAAIGAGASAAAGLVIGTALKMARRLKPDAAAIGIGLAAFVSVGLFQAPMALAIAILGPLSIALVWRRQR